MGVRGAWSSITSDKSLPMRAAPNVTGFSLLTEA